MFSHQDALLKYPYGYILSDFFDRKSGKIGRIQKICQNLLNHSFLLGGSYSHFFLFDEYSESWQFWSFLSFSNGTLKVTP